MESALNTYLDYYCGLEKPKFAVLVTGEWGVGKTTQVKACLPEDKRIYVSLFGVGSVEAAHAKVLAAAAPNADSLKKGAKRIARIAEGLPVVLASSRVLETIFEGNLQNSLSTDRVLVFDDLERSSINSKELLGVINYYVEQLDFRVVVIAHDKKLEKAFQDNKEKLFGQVIKAEPFVEEAFDCFLAELEVKKGEIVDEDKTEILQSFIREHEYYILNIFEVSEVKSLRILRHCLHDLKRLYECLSDEHLAHDEAMAHLVQLFVAFDCEVRAGYLDEEDLRGRLETVFNDQDKEDADNPQTRFIKAYKKYKPLDLSSYLLSDDVLISMLMHGRYTDTQIYECLNSHIYFMTLQERSPWELVYRLDTLSNDVVQKAIEQMGEQFSNRSVTNSGEILHIFALRIMMAEEGIVQSSVGRAVDECKKYIDDLFEQGALEPWIKADPLSSDWLQVHDRYSYWGVRDNNINFKEVRDYLVEKREHAYRQAYPDIVKYLLALFQDDPQGFFNSVAHNNNGVCAHEDTPIFENECASKIVDLWLEAPEENWVIINYAFEARYEYVKLRHGLIREIPFARSLLDELLKRADEAEGITKLRIKGLVSDKLQKTIDQVVLENEASL